MTVPHESKGNTIEARKSLVHEANDAMNASEPANVLSTASNRKNKIAT